MKRARNLDLNALLWALVFCFGVGDGRSVTGIFQQYLSVVKVSMGKSSFHTWMTKKELPEWLQGIVVHVMDKMTKELDVKLGGVLGQFKELFSIDSTIIKLHECLQNIFPGSRTNHSPAALKVHVVQKVSGSGVESIRVTDGKTADIKALLIGPWVRGALFLMDLGYYSFRKFVRIAENGGYFISRVKVGANPKIVKSLKSHRGRAVNVAGKRLKEILPLMLRQVIDIEVVVEFERRAYGGKKPRRDRQVLRLVGIWNAEEKRYHLYFTNLTPEQLSAEAIATAYSQRWQIELLFRQLKGVHRLDEIPGRNANTATAMIFSAIISMLVTRTLVTAIRDALRLQEPEAPHERAGRVIQRQCANLLRLVVLAPREVGRLQIDIERVLLDQVPDPNRGRRLLLHGIQNLMADGMTQTMTG